MTILNGLILALTVVLVVVGGLLAVVLWQLSVLMATLRGSMLPQIQGILGEARKSLANVERITQDVDGKLERLDATVDDAQVTVHAVATTARFFTEGFAKPALLNAATLVTGASVAWKKYREIRGTQKPKALPPRQAAKDTEPIASHASHPLP